MGMLVDGEWTTKWYAPDAEGRFVRPATVFRGTVELPVEAGRYHLYVSLACPWSHRVVLARALSGLEAAVPMTGVAPRMGDEGWVFAADAPDPVLGATRMSDVYVAADPRYTGRVTVPVLWDTDKGTVVNNESREIMRMFRDHFAPVSDPYVDLAPAGLQAEIDATIDAIYEPINNGVYRCGFATTQGAYEEAAAHLFEALDTQDAALGERRYLCGDQLTEADICLFVTLVRFDAVYHGHFKCNRTRIADFPNLSGYVRDIYQTPGVAETCDLENIRTHYYWSHESINPTRIVPVGPRLDFASPHRRGHLSATS